MSKKQNSKKSRSHTSGKLINYIIELLSHSLGPKDAETVSEVLMNCQNNIDSIINSSGKTKAVKDPNAPKRARSNYIFFCINNRDKIKNNNPEMSAKEVIQELGNRWKKLSKSEKKKYDKMSLKDKERYNEEMKNYTPPSGTIVKGPKPKRSLSAYLFFCVEQRPLIKKKFPQYSAKEITTELGKSWKSLKNRSKYEEKAKKDKIRFQQEKDASVKKVPEEKILKKSSKNSSKKGFLLFCQQHKNEYNEDKYSEDQIIRKLKRKWKHLTAVQQNSYLNSASQVS
jgi:high mobility group protein B1